MKTTKRLTLILTLVCMLSLLIAPCAFAMPGDTVNDDGLWRVFDPCGYLTSEENNALNAKAIEISDKYGIDTVVWIVDSCEGYSHMDYADDNFDYNNYGYGEKSDGSLLLIDMDSNNRGMWISTCGEPEFIYTQSDIDILEGLLIDDLRAGYFYDAIDLYLDKTDEFLYDELSFGDHVWSSEDSTYSSYGSDELTEGEKRGLIIGGGFVLGLIIALVFTIIWYFQMKTGVKATEARVYLVDGTFDLRKKQDRFLYSNVTKTRKESSSGGGGHGSHTSSSGRSHGGGGRSF